MRKLAVVGIAAVSLMAGGAIGSTNVPAGASSPTNTTTTTNTLISGRCYHHHSVGVTEFRWVKASGRYVAYTSPHRHTSDYNTCHK